MKHLVFFLIAFFLLPFLACKDSGPPTACECVVNAQHNAPDSTLVLQYLPLPPLDTALSSRCDVHIRSLSSETLDLWFKESNTCEFFTVSFKRSLSKIKKQ